MKKYDTQRVHYVVENLIKIMNYNKLNKVAFAEIIGFPEPKWNKITNGKQGLTIAELSIIAEKLQMREIDILTYPKVYVESDKINCDVEVELTVKLKEELKDSVLEHIFGNRNLELLNGNTNKKIRGKFSG